MILAVGLLVAFDASTTRLIQLYIIGVFVSFTVSQAGLVRHWLRLLPGTVSGRELRSMLRALVINGSGALTTGVVLVIVLLTKFTHGAWIVVIAMPVVFALMVAIHRHYEQVTAELTPPSGGVVLPGRVRVSRLHTPTLRALAFARASRPHRVTAVTVHDLGHAPPCGTPRPWVPGTVAVGPTTTVERLPPNAGGLSRSRRRAGLAGALLGLPALTGVLLTLRGDLSLDSFLLAVVVAVVGGLVPALLATVRSFCWRTGS